MSKQFSLGDFKSEKGVEVKVKSKPIIDNKFTFIEMFSGIGGFRLGLERSGWKCVWANEIDKYASKIYNIHYGYGELDGGDIRRKNAERIPDHTMLTAGFPCQSFSVAGKGRGFEDTRGTLFYEICRIAKAKKPKLLLLENVRGLLSNKGGETFKIILQTLEELGYWWEYQVLNSKHFGVPQSRQRVFIIGHIRGGSTKPIFPIGITNQFPKEDDKGEERITSCLDANYHKGARRQRIFVKAIGSEKPTVRSGGRGSLDKHAWDTIMVKDIGIKKVVNMHTKHKSQAGRVYDSKGISPTIKTPTVGQSVPTIIAWSKSKGKDGGKIRDEERIKINEFNTLSTGKGCSNFSSANYVNVKKITTSDILERKPDTLGRKMPIHRARKVGDNLRIRRLTPTECERLQGFPDGWTRWLSDTRRYKGLGNAVTVNVIKYLGKKLKECIQ